MSIPVELADLAERLGQFGDVAYLVTVGEDGAPHVVSVRASLDERRLLVGAGRRTTSNVQLHPAVTLLWPSPPGVGYSLIVDGMATPFVRDETSMLAVDPTGAVLHRTPDGDPAAPSCVTVLQRS
jgi:hypothetical protein